MKKSNLQKGYTLIELLAVMIVLITVGTIIAGIIVSALRGSNRSTSVNQVRQAGNFTLLQMSKMIRYAKSFDGIATNVSDAQGNLSYDADCTNSNGKVYSFLKFSSFDGGSTTFICNSDGNSTTIASYSGVLKTPNINASDKTLVNYFINSDFNATACSLTCSQASLSTPPIINIEFTVDKNNIVSNPLVENKVSIPFETAVSFRNNND